MPRSCDLRLSLPYLDFASEKPGTSPKQFKDYRARLDFREWTRVVATPTIGMHFKTIQACEAGKDVYVEKPLSLCVMEEADGEAVRRHQRNIAR